MIFTTNKVGCYQFTANEPIKAVLIKNSLDEVIYARKFDKPTKKFHVNFNKNGLYKIITDNNTPIVNSNIEELYIPYMDPLPAAVTRTHIKCVRKFTDVTGDGGSPASIQVKTGEVFLNDRFKRFPKYAQEFILEHEKGHLLYPDEDTCDYYALYNIVKRGGNITPCLIALTTILRKSPANNLRIKNFVSHLKKLT